MTKLCQIKINLKILWMVGNRLKFIFNKEDGLKVR